MLDSAKRRFLTVAVALAAVLSALPLAASRAAEPAGATINAARLFNVKDFGAAGDGTAKDTSALQKALDACAAAGGGTVLVPAGTYLTGTLRIGSHTALRLDKAATLKGSEDIADYPVMKVRWEGEWREGHSSLLRADEATHVAIVGEGTIQGPPLALAALRPRERNGVKTVRGPSIFEPIEVKNLTLEGFTVRYQRMWSLHITYCDNVLIRNVIIRTGSVNGDGIDIDSTTNVLIEKCDIDAGDDAIALKSGRGMEAVRIARPTENVIIRDCTLSSDFAGVGIGTEMSGGVRNVLIQRCNFVRCRQNGIFIKSKTNRGGFIENVTGEDLTVSERCGTFLGIDLVTKGIEASEPVTGDDRFPRVKDITFRNIRTENVPVLVLGRNIAPERPFENLTISNVTGTAKQGVILTNVKNARLQGIAVTLPANEPLLTLTNVTGSKLDEASVKAPGAGTQPR